LNSYKGQFKCLCLLSTDNKVRLDIHEGVSIDKFT